MNSVPVPDGTVTPAAAPELTDYDLLAPQLSGGKDSALMMHLFMEAGRRAGVSDRVRSYHASLGPLEWPAVTFGGRRWPGVSELAALQAQAFGLEAEQHIEVTRTLPVAGGGRVPRCSPRSPRTAAFPAVAPGSAPRQPRTPWSPWPGRPSCSSGGRSSAGRCGS